MRTWSASRAEASGRPESGAYDAPACWGQVAPFRATTPYLNRRPTRMLYTAPIPFARGANQ